MIVAMNHITLGVIDIEKSFSFYHDVLELKPLVKWEKDNTSSGNSLYFLDPDGHKLEIHIGNDKDRIKAKKMDLGNWKKVEWFDE